MMLVVYFLFSLLYFNCKSGATLSNVEQAQEQSLPTCITDIVRKYFSEKKSLTYVAMKIYDDEVLKAIHSSKVTAVVYRQATKQIYFRHEGYLIIAKTATEFTEEFKYLLREPSWNPYARFLIVINSLKKEELTKIFDELLVHYVINVLVVNGTKDAQVYTYNPYENCGCGKFYNRIISYGLCLQTRHNLFPNKLVTGLRNCTLAAYTGHWAPYSMQQWKSTDKLGTEQYVFKILADMEQFKVNFTVDHRIKEFTTITQDMQVSGPMEKLQKNETDVIFGGAALVSSRIDVFTYLCGHLDYSDEIRFLVKRASSTAIWKSAYLEFQPFVWCLLLIVFLLYSTIMVLLLRAEDKTEIMLKLLNPLLLHGCKIPDRTTVKLFFIIWVWFAYIMNSMYQSSLVSLTGNPIMERQILTEQDVYNNNMKPCISLGFLVFICSETNYYSPVNTECLDDFENVKIVARSEDRFSLLQNSVYKYYKKTFSDKYGRSPVYSLKRPYTKLIFGYFFRKGFPVSNRMRTNAIRLRENGLVNKNLKDHYYARKIKHHFHKKEFQTRFVMPWWLYAIGCVVASVVFIFELLFARYNKHLC